ncbi:hypothetical protein RCN06_04455, partial [Escherichia marmotae]|nr:hypothetical protein [Escherichia marmotae]
HCRCNVSFFNLFGGDCRCAFIGALTLYYYFIGFFGILAAIAITLVWQRHTRFFH